jgi:hypothetical protein
VGSHLLISVVCSVPVRGPLSCCQSLASPSSCQIGVFRRRLRRFPLLISLARTTSGPSTPPAGALGEARDRLAACLPQVEFPAVTSRFSSPAHSTASKNDREFSSVAVSKRISEEGHGHFIFRTARTPVSIREMSCVRRRRPHDGRIRGVGRGGTTYEHDGAKS